MPGIRRLRIFSGKYDIVLGYCMEKKQNLTFLQECYLTPHLDSLKIWKFFFVVVIGKFLCNVTI